MVIDILDYISSYDEIRAVTGLNSQELPDTTLALITYRNFLNNELSGISGVYPDNAEEETLEEIFARIEPTDPMYYLIQSFSIYSIGFEVLRSVGLRGYKTLSDGKATQTRFSSQASYMDPQARVLDALRIIRKDINSLLGISEEEISYIQVITPAVDIVTGE